MDQGFEKIDLSKKVKLRKQDSGKINNSMKRKTRMKFSPKSLGIAGAVVAFLILFSIFGIVLPAKKTISSAKKTAASAKLALAQLKNQDIAAASDQLTVAKADLAQTTNDLHSMGYLGFIPVINWYYNDASHLLAAANDGIQGGQLLVDSIKPYADVLGLKGGGHSFAGGSAQDRISLAVKTMDKITPQIDTIEKYLLDAKKEIDEVDPNHYPAIFGGDKVHKQLADVRTLTDQGATFITSAKPLVKIIPQLLGSQGEKKYLIIFQNESERRPTGGFMTDYAIFRVDQGVIKVDTSADIYSLDATISNHPVAPRPILEYMPQVPTFNLRDTNISPDFKVSMDNFMTLYKQAGGYKKVDGIIAIDTHVLVSTIKILGDIDVDGTTFSDKIVPQCDCPQVIYQLESMVDTPLNHIVNNRKGIIGDLMYAIMEKAFSSSPKLYWGPLFQTMITETNQKHILFDIFNDDAQQGLVALNAAGLINQDFTGDYLHINEANWGGAKSNLFVDENVTQNYKVNSDGSIVKTVTINYKNPYAPSDCNLEHGNLCLNSVLRNQFRLYVPKGSKLVDSSGSQVKMTSYDELGKTVFEGFMTVRPKGSATVTVSYELPFKVDNNSPLPLLIQKQPGTDKFDYTIKVNGTKVEEFPLLSDTTKKINLH
ncbi:MAG TPA: DUF4012 domain-containing protein [Candidatus Saccharimonadales bacterium]|nr:DUF4012 domain-containing protein [Candidatus Saccharimonadales bacterium]